MKPRERVIYLKGIFIVLAVFVTIEIVLLRFRNLQHSIPPTIHPMDINGTLKNISQLRNILIKGSLKNELPIKGIAKYPEKTYNIPPTIHMVWVWSEIPQKYIQNLLLMYEMNPHFSFYLWLDQNSLQNTTLISFISRERFRTKNVQHLQLNVPELIDDTRKKEEKEYSPIYWDVKLFLALDAFILMSIP
nr:uncharacterized protein LOC121131416 [Lepeophtheirus salmonis]